MTTIKSHKLKLVEGNEATKNRVYEYRGGTIKSRVRSHDYRNKSHPGYEWDYSLPGGFGGSTHKRSNAVFFIDFEIAKRENNTVELDRLKAIIRMGK